MGADNLINFHKWHKWRKFLRNVISLCLTVMDYKKKSLNSKTYKSLNKEN